METYVLKFSACLAVFWLVYILFLERQSMHRFKRFYLLVAIASALIIPTLTLTKYVESIPSDFEVSTLFVPFQSSLIQQPQGQVPFFGLETVLWSLYGLGVFIFAIRFIVNLYKIQKRISAHDQIEKRSFIYVLLEECHIPHSFFKYLFFERSKYETDTIPNEVKLHEETHAKQLHSLDIIAIELLQIVFWFHPLIYILKHHIKLNHEFLADQAVLDYGIDTKAYQTLLLQFSSNTHEYQLASAINYSSIKKRFTVMKTQTSKIRMWLSSLLLLPIVAILFFSFAEKEYVEKELEKTITISEPADDYQNVPKTILTVFINQDEEVFINDKPGNLESLEKTLQNLKVPKNYTINVNADKQFSSKITREVLNLIKTYGLLLNSSQIQLPNTQQKASYNPTFLEYIIEMEAEGAAFYLDDTIITAEQAKSIAKNNYGRQVKMLTHKDVNGRYIVKLNKQQKPPTEKELSAYNAWAKKVNEQITKAKKNKSNNYPIIKVKDANKYKAIYDRMTNAQRENAESWPNFPPPPPPPPSIPNKGKSQKNTKELVPPLPPKPKNVVVEGKPTKIVEEVDSQIPPPPPPPPPRPLEHMKKMVQKGASFYYEGKKISSKEAIELVSKNQNLNIKVQEKSLEKPRVYIYKS